ncbi:MAG: hypothetical protein JXB32_22895 [Deltaproteobacteria bacterium]|nr:hypothetical protein [Deltaproteobacteria bacterium]
MGGRTVETPWRAYRRANAVLDGELLRRPDEVTCAKSRRERRVDAHRVAGELYAALGNPQRAWPAIHVAGTSGKGSVAWAVAHLLRAAGLRVGLHVSPYLQVATEKVWIDGRYIDGHGFARIVDRVAPFVRRLATPDCPASIHGIASAAVAFEAFRRAGVEVAVVEASCGGRYDVTAHLDTRVAVVTSVGDDHRDVLGPTLRDVARHKAGILRRGAAAVSGATGVGREVLRAEARALGVGLLEVPARGRPVGALNRALAEATVQAFGVEPPVGAVVPPFPGRLETIAEAPRVVLDIAHNPEKARGLVRSLGADEGAVLVLGALRGKNLPAMLRTLAGRCRRVVFTTPAVTGKSPVPAEELRGRFGGWFEEARAVPEPCRALEAGLRLAGRRGTVLVTGSAYLVGALRGRWIPDRAVLLGRSSFPE